MNDLKTNRELLKATQWRALDTAPPAQRRGEPMPPMQRPYPEAAPLIDLPEMETLDLELALPIADAIGRRQSVRRYAPQPLSLGELAFLLWATQGVHRVHSSGRAVFRTVPSAGARHPFETYLVVRAVEELEAGLYRYLSLSHQLCRLHTEAGLPEQAAEAAHGQLFVAQAAVTFIWTAIPYRTEWRYSLAAAKLIALDAGHVCQNLYLAAEAVDCGVCAIAAYDQALMDALVRVDGEEEFTVYVAPVGKRP